MTERREYLPFWAWVLEPGPAIAETGARALDGKGLRLLTNRFVLNKKSGLSEARSQRRLLAATPLDTSALVNVNIVVG